MNTEIDHGTKKNLINKAGVGYYDFIKQLTPNYFLLWVQLLSGQISLLAIAGVLLIFQLKSIAAIIFMAGLGGILFGYALAYIMLFFHEAAHYNIAKTRILNDRLANIFIGAFFGQDIKNYRSIHYGHHRHHGQIDDTEHTYFDPINLEFIVTSLTGIKLFKVLRDRKKRLKSMQTPSNPGSGIQLALGIFINSSILAMAYHQRAWTMALAWLLGLFIFFPFFAAVRQVLEHRNESAKSTEDYYKTPHGIVNRLFGDGPWASSFGGAGFNRHLLHHWEPKISYTRLKEFEIYLRDTQIGARVQERTTTYWKTFRGIFNH